MKNRSDYFGILRRLAVGSARGDDFSQLCQSALAQASALVGLQAASLMLFGSSHQVTLKVNHAADDEPRRRLESLEHDLYSQLRRQRDLQAAYLTFGADEPYQTFTLPLKHGKAVFGAVIGLYGGVERLVAEDDFLEALTALLALMLAAREVAGDAAGDDGDQERAKMEGIRETAITVNHEINSPLTAILGNIQLIKRSKGELDERLLAKLETIEESADRIQKVTKRLLEIQKPRSVEYNDGIQMLDISDEADSDKE